MFNFRKQEKISSKEEKKASPFDSYIVDLKTEQTKLETGNLEGAELEECLNKIDEIRANLEILKKYGNKKSFLNEKFESLKSKASKFSRKIIPIKYVALALMTQASMAFSQSKNEVKIKDFQDNKIEDTRTIKKTSTEKSDRTAYLDAYWRFVKENETGGKNFNIDGVIAPFSIEFGSNKTIQENVEAQIPLTYANDFKSTEFTNEKDPEKMEKYLENQIRKTFANMLLRIGETKGVYRAQHEGEDNLLENKLSKTQITSIKITGFSSPEAAKFGSSSVIPGNQEQQNIDLAKTRAEITKSVVDKILKENNIDSSIIDSISYEEVQFSDSEWNQLLNLADSLEIKGVASEDRILELVSRYNAGEYNDNLLVKKIMDEVVGNKRGVSVEIELETKEKKQVIIPIPLLLLLLLSRRVRRGLNPFNWFNKKEEEEKEDTNKDEKDVGPVVIKPEPNPELTETRQIFSEKDLDVQKVENKEFNYYELYQKADKDIEAKDKNIIRNKFIKEEIAVYLDDLDSIKYGLNYRNLLNYIFLVLRNPEKNRYNTEEELKIEISKMLLNMWQEYDRNIRQKAGITINEKTTLDYRHDEKKILWAKIATVEILRLVKESKTPEEILIQIRKDLSKIEEEEKEEGEMLKGSFKDLQSDLIKPIEDNAGQEPLQKDEKPAEKENLNRVELEEYSNIKLDLEMINKAIQNSEGIVNLNESDFKSEYGRKRYNELKNISEGDKPISFNKTELEKIGVEMEKYLKENNPILVENKTEDIAKVFETEENKEDFISKEEVEKRAYFIYQERLKTGEIGDQNSDWFKAISEIKQERIQILKEELKKAEKANDEKKVLEIEDKIRKIEKIDFI